MSGDLKENEVQEIGKENPKENQEEETEQQKENTEWIVEYQTAFRFFFFFVCCSCLFFFPFLGWLFSELNGKS